MKEEKENKGIYWEMKNSANIVEFKPGQFSINDLLEYMKEISNKPRNYVEPYRIVSVRQGEILGLLAKGDKRSQQENKRLDFLRNEIAEEQKKRQEELKEKFLSLYSYDLYDFIEGLFPKEKNFLSRYYHYGHFHFSWSVLSDEEYTDYMVKFRDGKFDYVESEGWYEGIKEADITRERVLELLNNNL